MNMRASIQSVFVISLPICFLLATSLHAATVDGMKIHSTVAGNGSRAVILVHGWTCDERTWKLQIPALSKDYRVITLDLPGHGQSEFPKDGKMSMDLFARAIEAVRKERKADRVVLVGHSMGVAAIMQYARLYPKRTVALVLVDGSVTFPPDSTIRERMLSFAARYADSLSVRRAGIEAMSIPTTSQAVKDQALAMVLSARPATAVGAMEALVDPANWKEDVFAQPVLVVLSELGGDEGPENDLNYMKIRFPNLDYTKLHAGHFLMLERPEEFNELLLTFLSKLKY